MGVRLTSQLPGLVRRGIPTSNIRVALAGVAGVRHVGVEICKAKAQVPARKRGSRENDINATHIKENGNGNGTTSAIAQPFAFTSPFYFSHILGIQKVFRIFFKLPESPVP